MKKERLIDLEELESHILEPLDRDYFREAIECYAIGSYRAATILCWNLTCDNLKRKLHRLSKEDGEAMKKWLPIELKEKENSAFEEDLLNAFESLGILNDSEKTAILHVRQLRHYSAHPTTYQVTAEEVRSSFRVCVNTVLSRPYYRGHSFITQIEDKMKDPWILPDNGYSEVVTEMISPVRPELLPKLAQTVVEAVQKNPDKVVKKNSQKILEGLVGIPAIPGIKEKIVNEVSVLKDFDLELLTTTFNQDKDAIEYLDFPCRQRIIRFLIEERILFLHGLGSWRREHLATFVQKEIQLEDHKDWVIQLVKTNIIKIPQIVQQLPEYFKEFAYDKIVSDLEYRGWSNYDTNNSGCGLLKSIGLASFSDMDEPRKIRLVTSLSEAAKVGANDPKVFLSKFQDWNSDWRAILDKEFANLLSSNKIDSEIVILYMKDRLDSLTTWPTSWDIFFQSRDVTDYRPHWYKELGSEPLKSILTAINDTATKKGIMANSLIALLNKAPQS